MTMPGTGSDHAGCEESIVHRAAALSLDETNRGDAAHSASRPRRMSGIDMLFVKMDRRSAYQHTLKIAIVDPSEDPAGWSFDRYRGLVEQQLRAVPLMRQRFLNTPLGLHRPIWVDDPDFDLDVHLRRVHCPQPGGMAEFCTLVEQVYCHPLDHERPLWQVWVVEGLQDGRVGLLALIHHSYADGAGMRSILEQMTSSEPRDLSLTAGSDLPMASPLPSRRIQLAWAAHDIPPLIRAVPPTLKAVRERLRLEREYAARGASDRPTAADKRRPQPFGGVLSRGRRFACGTVSLADMQLVRKSLGGTVNDVFLSCVAGSVRAFLMSRGKACNSPLVAAMPLTTIPTSRREAIGGNFSSSDDIWLHAEIEDPIERLAATRASAQATKDHFAIAAKADPFALADCIPGGLLAGAARLNERSAGLLTPVSNVIVSNVRGFEERRYLGRWRLEQWFSTGQIWHGATLNFTGWSYTDDFDVCVLADSSHVSDAWPLIEQFKTALKELVGCSRAGRPE